jgi:hypothetical protein
VASIDRQDNRATQVHGNAGLAIGSVKLLGYCHATLFERRRAGAGYREPHG